MFLGKLKLQLNRYKLVLVYVYSLFSNKSTLTSTRSRLSFLLQYIIHCILYFWFWSGKIYFYIVAVFIIASLFNDYVPCILTKMCFYTRKCRLS